MNGGITIVPLDVECRVCGRETTLHVSPTEKVHSGGTQMVVEVDGHHRVLKADCAQCGCERVHAPTVLRELSDGGEA